jgi:hypothetical protein
VAGSLRSIGIVIPLAIGSLLVVAACSKQSATLPPDVARAMAALPEKIDYNWDVRPILSANCLLCHGNDVNRRKAGLRLDVRDSAYGPTPDDRRHRAVAPHQPWNSELVKRILTDDPDRQMPTQDSHKSLSAREKAILFKWVEQGAKYDRHWSYVAPKIAEPAKSPWEGRAINAVDRYVFAGLVRNGLSPSPEADRETLINRVNLDLTGLPPTLKEVDAFVADRRPDAYERVVDRLLASPAYGERMATYWMDVARYGESDGYLDDNFGRLIYPWRDWVISAFNKDIPYDQFVTWQLAGDLLPHPTQEQLIATSFGRLGQRSTENGITDEEYRVEYRNERTELVGKAFLGLTVQCAKCHDHKYDVISQADYYSMTGFFNSVDERGFYAAPFTRYTVGPTLPWPTPNQSKAWNQAKTTLAAMEANLADARKAALDGARARVDARMKAQAAQLSAGVRQDIGQATVAYYPLDDAYQGPLDSIMVVGRPIGQIPANKARGASLPPLDIPGVPSDNPRPPVQGPPLGPPGAAPPGPPIAGVRPLKVAFTPQAPGGVSRPAAGLEPGPGQERLPQKPKLQPGPGQEALGAKAPPAKPSAPPTPVLPDAFKAENLRLSHGGLAGEPPAMLNKAILIPGARGKGFLVNDNLGFLGPRDVGRFERTQPFSLDLWIKPRADKPYGAATIVNYQDHNVNVADAGYSLLSDHDHVRFDLIHASPFNMISVISKTTVPRGQWSHVAVAYDGSSRAEGVTLYIDGKPVATDVLHDHLTRSAIPAARFGSVVLGGGFFGFTFGKRFRAEEFNGGALDEIRILNRALTPLEAAFLHDDKAVGQASGRDVRASLTERELDRDPRVIAAKAKLQAAKDRENLIASKVRELMVMGDQPKVRPTYVLDHGLFDHPSKEVKPQGLERVFSWDGGAPRNRLGLAKWLFDKKNPLTSRVFVNRLWQQHMGVGIVETVEDFGTQGAIPSNPQLLDWLAVEFQHSGWDIKHMQKLMVMSATYRQTSTATEEALKRDPKNAIYGRGPRFRMTAEAIRDNALFASGLLVDKKGGDSVFPYQPDGVWAAGAGANLYPTDMPADDQHRRSMYTFIKRASPPPSLAVFDQPDRSTSAVARRISNTPLQALVLLNDVQYVEAYRKLAERVLDTAKTPDDQLVLLFRLSTRRRPIPDELATLKTYYAAQADHFGRKPGEAAKLLSAGVAPLDAKADPARLAALTMVAAAVMNSPDAYSIR